MSRYRNVQIEPESEDLDDEGRPRNVYSMDGFDYLTPEEEALEGMVGTSSNAGSKLVSGFTDRFRRSSRRCTTRETTRRTRPSSLLPSARSTSRRASTPKTCVSVRAPAHALRRRAVKR